MSVTRWVVAAMCVGAAVGMTAVCGPAPAGVVELGVVAVPPPGDDRSRELRRDVLPPDDLTLRCGVGILDEPTVLQRVVGVSGAAATLLKRLAVHPLSGWATAVLLLAAMVQHGCVGGLRRRPRRNRARWRETELF